MAGRWKARSLAAIALVGLVCGIVLPRAAHAQGEDDFSRLIAEVGRLHSLGKHAEAAPIAERAVALARKRYGEDRAEFASAIAWLASVYSNQGRYAEAQPLYERTVAVYEKALGPGHPHVGTSLNNLAELYIAQGRYADAELLHKRALGIREKALGPEHPSVAQSHNNLAGVYRVRGQYADAEPLYKRSLAIWEKALGPEHHEVGTALSNLATLYQHQGRYADAEPLYRRSLAIREKALGPEHADVSNSLNNLAGLHQSQGFYGEAERLFKRSLAIREKTQGPEHPAVALSLNNLAALYQAQGRISEAELLYKRSLVIREKKLGPEHPNVAQTLNNLAVLYASQARYPEAETLHRRSLAIREKALGLDHPDVALSLNNLAELFRAQGRTSEAAALYRRSLAVWEKTLGTDHSLVGTALNNLALLYSSQRNFTEAERLYRRSLAIAEALGPEHPDVGRVLNNLAGLYKDQGRTADADPLYLRSLAISEKALGPEHYLVGRSLNNLALLYLAQGRHADAELLYRRSLTISEKALGPNHPEVGTVLSNLAGLAYDQSDWGRAAEYWSRSTGIIKRGAERGLAADQGEMPGGETRRRAWQFWGLVKTTHRLAGTGLSPTVMAAEMFETAQWAQVSEAAASLAAMAARSAKGSPQLASLVRERQDLAGEWQAKDKLFIASKSEPPAKRKPDAEKVLAHRLAAIDTRVAEIDQRLAQDFPDYTALAGPLPVSVAEVQAQLSADEALVLFLDTPEWRPLPEETIVWVVTKSEVRWVRSDIGTASLAREVAALRCGLDATAWDGNGGEKCARTLGIPLDKAPGPNDPLPFDHARAHKLYAALFGEVGDLIKGKHLLIVPSGPLTQLPFQVLVTTEAPASGNHRSVAWLTREHPITVLPAVSSLKALRRIGKPSAAPRPMIGFGNPLLDGPDASYAEAAKLAREKQRCPETRWQRIAALVGLRPGVSRIEVRGGVANVAAIRNQTPLPETADELCAVAQDVKAGGSDVYLGARATEREIKRLSGAGELAKYRMVHFATHGFLSGQLDGTHEPGLILTPPGTATEEDDGYLSASEIAALKLDADLVILSACNTAAGAATSAEALSGLARAFIYSQTRALLVSHWEVYSDATVKLITATVREMARDPKVGRSEALRRSMLALIDKGDLREAHPAYWAPFVVVGEGAAAR